MEVQPKNKLAVLAWFIWCLGAINFFTQYIIRVAPSTMVSELINTFSASSLQISSFGAYFMYSYVAMQIPVGIFLDKFGARLCLSISILLCALANYAFTATNSLIVAQLARFIIGFGASFAFISTLKLAKAWFDEERFSVLVGITQALGMVGGATGAAVLVQLAERISWQTSLQLVSAILFVISGIIFLVVRNSPPKTQAAQDNVASEEAIKPLAGLKIVLQNKQSWLVSIFAGLLFLPSMVLQEMWGSFFLTNVHNVNLKQANFAISLVFIAWALGGPIAGKLANKIGRKATMQLSALAGAIIVPLVIFSPPLNAGSIYSLMFLFGLTNTGLVAAYTAVSEQNPEKVSGVALGFANGMSVIIGAFCQQLVGAIIDWQLLSRGAINVAECQPSELRLAMLVAAIASIAALAISFWIQETKPDITEKLFEPAVDGLATLDKV